MESRSWLHAELDFETLKIFYVALSFEHVTEYLCPGRSINSGLKDNILSDRLHKVG